MMCEITAEEIPTEELREEFVRTAAGPGGQKINKTSSGVRLIFAAEQTSLLDEAGKIRLRILAGISARLEDGSIAVQCHETRSLTRNRELALQKLVQLINEARKVPRKRKKTKPTRASVQRRLAEKSRRSEIKAGRKMKNSE